MSISHIVTKTSDASGCNDPRVINLINLKHSRSNINRTMSISPIVTKTSDIEIEPERMSYGLSDFSLIIVKNVIRTISPSHSASMILPVIRLLGGTPKTSNVDSQIHKIQHQVTIHTIKRLKVLVITQRDITKHSDIEQTIAELLEAQHGMLCRIFPRHIIEGLSTGQCATDSQEFTRSHTNATILFMDIVGFTSMSKVVAPTIVMKFITKLFGLFDDLCDLHNVQKIETAGDSFIVSAGILTTDIDNYICIDSNPNKHSCAKRVMLFAIDMLKCAKSVAMPDTREPTSIRIGIHTGQCTSGLVGSKVPKFGIFGDTMNTASRMESTCTPDKIQVSEVTWGLIRNDFVFSATGGIHIKGVGMRETYIYNQ